MNEKSMPPNNIDVEESLLSAVIINPAVLNLITLSSFDFYLGRNQSIWKAIESLREKKSAIDVVTVSAELETAGKLQAVGGMPYLAKLASTAGVSYNAESYAKIVREKSLRRIAIRIASDLAQKAFNSETTIEEVMGAAVIDLNKGNSAGNKIAVHMSEWADATIEEIERTAAAYRRGEFYAISTGYPHIDEMLGGGLFSRNHGSYVVIAGPPGLGKSILLSNIAENIAKKNKAIAVFSMEMSKQRWTMRSLSNLAKVPVHRMKTGAIADHEIRRLKEAKSRYDILPLYVDDERNRTTGQLRAELMRLKEEHGIEAFVVDYLGQLGDPKGNMKKAEWEEMVGKRIMDICRDLEIAGVVIHTLTKEGMKARRPTQADMTGGGGLVYDADASFGLTQSKRLYDSEAWQAIDVVELKGRDNESPRKAATLGKFFDYPLFIMPDEATIDSKQWIRSPFEVGNAGSL